MSSTVAASWKRWASRTQTRTASLSGEIRESGDVMHLGNLLQLNSQKKKKHCCALMMLSTMLTNYFIGKQYIQSSVYLIKCENTQ